MTELIAKTKHLLIVSFSYSPMLNPRAFRWTALAEEFARRGVRVQVVCSWQPGLASHEMVNGVEICRTGNRLIERCRALLAQLRGHSVRGTGASPDSPLARLVGRVWRNMAWPDTTCVWYRAALAKATALLSASPGATVVTVSPSFTAHQVGATIARSRRTGRWVADMGDPFSLAIESPANNFYLYGALNRRAERALFQKATAVTLTNATIRKRYGELYPESAERIFVIPPLLPALEKLSITRNAPVANATAALRLVYVGSLYKSLRRPDFLLALFSALSGTARSRLLELHFLGNIEECNDAFAPYAELIGSSIRLHGLVAQEQALAAVRDASLVVNLGNANPCQLPSKLVEYMALGKPILNIIQTSEDPSQDMLQGYRSVLTILASGITPTLEQVQDAARFIDQAVCSCDGCNDGIRLEQFGLNAIANQYASLLFGEQACKIQERAGS